MNQVNRIQDHYQLGERIGTGGQASVYKAHDEKLERTVAIKILAEHLTHDDHFIERFRYEARAAAGLQHPHIIQVFDFNQDSDSDRYFIVMEYLEGPSLAEKIRLQGRIPAEEMVPYLIEAARGLDYAHERGVIHRDIKPANLQFTKAEEGGRIKLVDFGIAKIAEQPHLTQVGSLLGTAAYFAPEQLAGQSASAQSDIYALGICAYQGLHGDVPHTADNIAHLVMLRQEMPPALDELHPDVPIELAKIVDWCLAPRREDRPHTAKELIVALEQIGGDATTALLPYTGAIDRGRLASTPGEDIQSRPRGLPPARHQKKRIVGAAILLLALLLVGIGLSLIIPGDDQTQPSIAPVDTRSLDRQIPAFKEFILEHTDTTVGEK